LLPQFKKFVDIVAKSEHKNARELLMPMNDAKALRDEIAKLLASRTEETIDVVVSAGTWGKQP